MVGPLAGENAGETTVEIERSPRRGRIVFQLSSPAHGVKLKGDAQRKIKPMFRLRLGPREHRQKLAQTQSQPNGV